MLIEDASSFRINHRGPRILSFEVEGGWVVWGGGASDEEKNNSCLTRRQGRKIRLRNAVQNTGENRAKGRQRIRDTGKGVSGRWERRAGVLQRG